jgi:hypothetical protein
LFRQRSTSVECSRSWFRASRFPSRTASQVGRNLLRCQGAFFIDLWLEVSTSVSPVTILDWLSVITLPRYPKRKNHFGYRHQRVASNQSSGPLFHVDKNCSAKHIMRVVGFLSISFTSIEIHKLTSLISGSASCSQKKPKRYQDYTINWDQPRNISTGDTQYKVRILPLTWSEHITRPTRLVPKWTYLKRHRRSNGES